LCNPPDTFLFVDLRPIIETEIKVAVDVVPEQVAVISTDADRTQKLRNLKNIRLVMRLSPILPLLSLLAITVLAVRSFGGWLNWWGYPFLFAGLVSLSLTALSRPLSALIFQFLLVPLLPGTLPPDVMNVFRDLVASIVYHAVRPTLIGAGILALVGFGMVAIAFLFRKRLQKRPVN
jgi:hypothetical protein